MSYMYHYCGFLVKEFYSNVFYILVEKSWQLHKGCTNFHFHQVCMRTFKTQETLFSGLAEVRWVNYC